MIKLFILMCIIGCTPSKKKYIEKPERPGYCNMRKFSYNIDEIKWKD